MTKILVSKLFNSHAIVYPALLAAFLLGTVISTILPQAFDSPAAETQAGADRDAQLLGSVPTGDTEFAANE